MQFCPRCHLRKLEVEIELNSLSRRDNLTYICTDCGKEESLIDDGLQKPGSNELVFVRMLEAKKEAL